MNKDYEIIKFEDGDFSLDVNVLKEDNTVWLSQKDMAILFEVSTDNIGLHVKNIITSNVLDYPTTEYFSVVQNEGSRKVTRKIKIYNLDMIIAVGNRIKSKRTELFKTWSLELLNKSNNKIALVEPIIKFEYENVCLDVTVSPEKETVWLTQKDMAVLFGVSVDNISLHIKNILTDGELDDSVFEESSITASDGKKYKVQLYNLDMIISVGCRVKSKRGIIFRKWAFSILKQYLINGYAVNENRILAYQTNILQLEANMINIENRLKNVEQIIYADNYQIIFEGEILEPYTFLRKLFFLARKELIIIDQYADNFIISMLSDLKVKIKIITSNNSYLNTTSIPENITIEYSNKFHDRYIIVDDIVYVIGTSFNDIGKKRFGILRFYNITKDILLKDMN